MPHWVCLVLVVMAIGVPLADACSCMEAHPQTHFCDADYVIKAKVKNEGQTVYSKTQLENGKSRRYPMWMKYRISVIKVLKESPDYGNVSHHFLYTPYEESACGIRLDAQTKYVLAGHLTNNKLQIDLCSLVMEWGKVPVRMRKGFNFQYEKNCDCQVKFKTEWIVSEKLQLNYDDHCELVMWDDPGRCYNQHSMCKRYRDEDGDGDGDGTGTGDKCRWTRPRAWKDCMKKAKEDAWLEP